MKHIILAIALVSGPRLAVADHAQDVDNCKGRLAAVARHANALATFGPDGESSKFDDIVRDFNSDRDQAKLCVERLPAGADRTTLLGEYNRHNTATFAAVKLAITKFREHAGFRHDVAKLLREIASAPPGSDLEAAVTALEKRIAGAQNPYATEAWRAAQRKAFEYELELHRRVRVEAASKADTERIERNTVLSRHPGFTSLDASRPNRVADAFDAATAKDLVVIKGSPIYAPTQTQNFYHHHEIEDTSRPEEPNLVTFTRETNNTVSIRYRAGVTELPDDVPGLVWEVVSPDEVVVVSMDGARYVTSSQLLVAGTGTPASWPAKPYATALTDPEIATLAKAGVVDARRAATVAAHQNAFEKCTKRLWAAHDPTFDAIAAADLRDSTRRTRVDQLNSKVAGLIRAQCSGHVVAFDKAWHAVLADYVQLRTKTLARIRKRLDALVAKAP